MTESLNKPPIKFLSKLMVQLAGFGICVVSVTALIWYVIQSPTLYNWQTPGVGMAIPTSICFLIVGASIIALARNGNGNTPKDP